MSKGNELKPNVEYVRAWNNADVKKSCCVVYCQYHNYYLTSRQLKQKGCESKNCPFMQKLEHTFWKLKEKKKREKKERKLRYGTK